MSCDTNKSSSFNSLKTDARSKDIKDSQLTNIFKNAATQTVEKYFSYAKFSLFQKLYPEIYKTYPSDLKTFHNQLVCQLKSCFLETVEDICSESNVLQSLSSLDNIIIKNSDDSKHEAWRPSGNPHEDIRDHLYHVKLKQKRDLEFILEVFTTENNSLDNIMRNKHEEIARMKSKVDDIKQGLYKHFNNLNDPTIIELVENLVAVEQETT